MKSEVTEVAQRAQGKSEFPFCFTFFILELTCAIFGRLASGCA
jgi:hypothetical protein